MTTNETIMLIDAANGATSTSHDDSTFFLALLDIPKETVLGINGHSLCLQRDDFVGIGQVPQSHTNSFHLVTIRCKEQQQQSSGMVWTTGFCLITAAASSPKMYLRRYDPSTEEWANATTESDATTMENLSRQFQEHPQSLLGSGRVVTYPQIMNSIATATATDGTSHERWVASTQYMVSSGILQRRHLNSGDKIVPGICTELDEEESIRIGAAHQHPTKETNETTASAPMHVEDGQSVLYPPIPILHSRLSTHKHHKGTRRYLATLTPSQRTALFTRTTENDNLFHTILEEYHGGSWQEMLGDLQLSHTLFVQLHCWSSLEHWKDLVALLCLSFSIEKMIPLYRALIVDVLPLQLDHVDAVVNDDEEQQLRIGDDSNSENLTLGTCLHFLSNSLKEATHLPPSLCTRDEMGRFCSLVETTFPHTPSSGILQKEEKYHEFKHCGKEERVAQSTTTPNTDSEDDDDDDSVVVVEMADIEAAMKRSQDEQQHHLPRTDVTHVQQQAFPFLVAARQPHEDILMTCARVLDEQNDVTLVRQAARYLEESETTTTTVSSAPS